LIIKKLTTGLIISSSILSATEIKPTIDMRMVGEYKKKSYSTLGSTIYGVNNLSYHDYVIGGSVGLDIKSNSYKGHISLYNSLRLADKDTNSMLNEKIWYNEELKNISYIGELYLEKNYKNHNFRVGRQTIDYNLVNENKRITNNSYEGFRYQNNQKDLKVTLFYFDKVASSTLANTVPKNHYYGYLGYGRGYDVGGFTKLSKHITNKDLDTKGALYTNIRYKKSSYDFELENLYVDNFFNTANLLLGYKIGEFSIKASTIYQSPTGDDHLQRLYKKQVQSTLNQLQLMYHKDMLKIIARVSKTPANNDAIYSGSLISPFSNRPAFIKGVGTSHAFIGGTVSRQILALNTHYIHSLPIT
jgi:hypothetical protein